jgi:hypothetical protein
MPDDIGGVSANALICPCGGKGYAFKADATNAAARLTSTPKGESRFTIARPAGTKCANGTSWLCGDGVKNAKRLDCHSCNLSGAPLFAAVYVKKNPSDK